MTTDANNLPKLTERQQHILAALIHSYIHKPEPVSSGQLAETTETERQ